MDTRRPVSAMGPVPPELVLAILNMVPDWKRQRLNATCTARLVSRAWNRTLAPVLFQRARFTLTKKGGSDSKQVHTLNGMCELLQGSPYLCSLIETLIIADDMSVVDRDDDGDSDDDGDGDGDGSEDDGEEENDKENDSKAGLKKAKCATDPALLRRVLSYLPRLHDLRLRHVLLAESLSQRDRGSIRLNIPTLRIILPGFDDGYEHADQVAYITKNILTIFDGVDWLRLNVGYEDLDYTGLPKDLATATEPDVPYQIHSFTTIRAPQLLLKSLAQAHAFAGLREAHWGGVRARDVNTMLSAIGGTASKLHFEIAEPFKWEENPEVVDLSPCSALSDLTLVFHLLTNYQPRGDRLAKHVNNTLLSLLNRPPSSTPLSHLMIWITLNRDEPRPDGEWRLSPSSMCTLENTLLQLVDAHVCSSVLVRFDLQRWYHYKGSRARPPFNNPQAKIDHDANLRRNAKKCEEALIANLPRLHQRQLMTIDAAPVDLIKPFRDEENDD